MTVANGEVTREVPVMPGGQRSDPACAHCHDLAVRTGRIQIRAAAARRLFDADIGPLT